MSSSGNLSLIADFIGPFMSAEVIGGISSPFHPASRKASIAPGTYNPWGRKNAMFPACPPSVEESPDRARNLQAVRRENRIDVVALLADHCLHHLLAFHR